MTFLVTVGDISLALPPQCCLLLLLLVLTAASPVSVSKPHQQIHQTCLNTTYQLSGYLGPLLIFELCFGKLVVKNVFASIDQP